jgi:hypothetical protein
MALMERPQPPAETAAQRYARDYSLQQGDWQNDVNGDLVYNAPDTNEGRRHRTIGLRGGDVYYTYDAEGAPVEELDVNGRNEREYVNYATGDSAVAGAGKSDRFDDLKANS